MWRAGRVSLLAVVLNYVLSSVSTKLGAGAPGCRAACCVLLVLHSNSGCGYLFPFDIDGSLSSAGCMSHVIHVIKHGAYVYCGHSAG